MLVVHSNWNAHRNVLHGGKLAPMVELNLTQTDVPTMNRSSESNTCASVERFIG